MTVTKKPPTRCRACGTAKIESATYQLCKQCLRSPQVRARVPVESAVTFLVRALYRVAADTGEPRVHLPDLVLAAWQLSPTHFGLPGYADRYPDSKRVEVAMFQSSGAIRRGYVRSLGGSRYCLTESGGELVERLEREAENGTCT